MQKGFHAPVREVTSFAFDDDLTFSTEPMVRLVMASS